MSPAGEGSHVADLAAHIQSILGSSHSRPQLSRSVLPAILDGVFAISQALRTAPTVSQVGTANVFGDDQLNVDVLAEQIVREAIATCPAVVAASSEEDPVERSVDHSDGAAGGEEEEQYAVAFDPLDGSSIIAPNWTVGTIVGVWAGKSALQQDPDESLVAAVLGVYGPRTTATIAIRSSRATKGSCFEVSFGADGSYSITRPDISLNPSPFKTRYFAPANLRAAAEDEAYARLVNRFIREKYTLRYSGGLVPDVVHALVKGHGIYLSPVTETSKAKLRRLYELAPVALVVECAGGSAVDSASGRRVLADAVKETDERGGLICGTREEVEQVVEGLAVK